MFENREKLPVLSTNKIKCMIYKKAECKFWIKCTVQKSPPSQKIYVNICHTVKPVDSLH